MIRRTAIILPLALLAACATPTIEPHDHHTDFGILWVRDAAEALGLRVLTYSLQPVGPAVGQAHAAAPDDVVAGPTRVVGAHLEAGGEDQAVQRVLATAHHHLPVRARFTASADGDVFELLLRDMQIP